MRGQRRQRDLCGLKQGLHLCVADDDFAIGRALQIFLLRILPYCLDDFGALQAKHRLLPTAEQQREWPVALKRLAQV